MKYIYSFFASVILATSARAVGLDGFWSGTAMRGGESTSIRMRIETTPDGLNASYDIPQLSLEGMPLSGITYDTVTGKLSASHIFTGTLKAGQITGELHPALLHGPPANITMKFSEAPPNAATNERDVQFVSRGNVLNGRLVTPRALGRHPAMVSLHGSGPSTRWLALARARRFAEAGYAMLIYDKPGSGESTGDWTMTSLDEMAQDAIAAVDFLRAQPEINASKVGLWGHSQAGNIISRAGAISNNIAFSIVLSGGGATPREVENFGYLGRLKHANASAESIATAMSWVRDYFEYVRTGKGYEALSRRLKVQPTPDWVNALDIGTVYPLPEQQSKWQWVATYSPREDIQRIRFPILLLFSDADESSPAEKSMTTWRRALAAGGNRQVESKMFKDADHHFLSPAHTDGWPRMSPDYYAIQINWLGRVAG